MISLVWPIPASLIPTTLSSGLRFGAARTSGTTGPHAHQGVDLGGYLTPVYAAADGFARTVADLGDKYGGPGLIELEHADGWITRYLHLDPGTFLIKKNDVVTAGTQLAQTALLKGGESKSHLHFEVREPDGTTLGNPVDPWPLLKAAATGGGLLAGAAAAAAVYYALKLLR